MQRGPTREQLEIEELNKKLRIANAKLRIAQDGVDVSLLPQQKLDMVVRIFDDIEQLQKDNQAKVSKIQQEGNAAINKVNQEANKKFDAVQKRYQDLIASLKTGQPQTDISVQPEPAIEEVREKTHEEKVAEITDIVLNAMRDSVSIKVGEILKITTDTTYKSATAVINDGPADKDIPVTEKIMMSNTEEVDNRRKEEGK